VLPTFLKKDYFLETLSTHIKKCKGESAECEKGLLTVYVYDPFMEVDPRNM
jgi:hypothetical protein